MVKKINEDRQFQTNEFELPLDDGSTRLAYADVSYSIRGWCGSGIHDRQSELDEPDDGELDVESVYVKYLYVEMDPLTGYVLYIPSREELSRAEEICSELAKENFCR